MRIKQIAYNVSLANINSVSIEPKSISSYRNHNIVMVGSYRQVAHVGKGGKRMHIPVPARIPEHGYRRPTSSRNNAGRGFAEQQQPLEREMHERSRTGKEKRFAREHEHGSTTSGRVSSTKHSHHK